MSGAAVATDKFRSGGTLEAYSAFVRAAFHKMLAYRLRYYTGVVTYLIYVTTYAFLWRAFYQGSGRTEVGGFDYSELRTYVVIGWLARSFYFNNIDREIADLVEEGQLANALIRPVSFPAMMFCEALGQSLFRLLFFTPPLALVLALAHPLQLPPAAWLAVAFAVSCALSLAILVQINFLVGLLALRLKSIQGVMRAKHYLLELGSGLLMPIALFPDWLATVSRWLPFECIAYSPGSIWLGRWSAVEVLEAIARQGVWVAVLGSLVALGWRRAARRITIQGG